MNDCIPKRLTGIRDYVYCLTMSASTVAFDSKFFILLDPSQPSIINAVILYYG
jgi:hypothetical protein